MPANNYKHESDDLNHPIDSPERRMCCAYRAAEDERHRECQWLKYSSTTTTTTYTTIRSVLGHHLHLSPQSPSPPSSGGNGDSDGAKTSG